jgi:PAS domain S-box-containing protein
VQEWKAEAGGQGVFRHAFGPAVARPGGGLRLAGAVITAALFVITLLAWHGLRQRETQMLEGQLAAEAGALARRIEAALHERVSAIDRMALRWEVANGTPRPLWEMDAAAYMSDMPGGYLGIGWVDAAGIPRWVLPEQGYETIIREGLARDLLRGGLLARARHSMRPAFGFVDRTVQEDGRALVLVRALTVAGRPDGFMIAGFDGVKLLESLMANLLERDYEGRIIWNGEPVYAPAPVPIGIVPHVARVRDGIGDWQIEIWPTRKLLAAQHSRMPEWVFAAGMLLSALVGLVFLLGDRSRRRAAEAEAAMAQADSARRMLQTVLDTVPMSIFWKDRNHVYLGCNQAFATDAGKDSPEALRGLTDHDLAWREMAGGFQRDDAAVMESGTPRLHYEEEQIDHAGRRQVLRTSKVPLRAVGGEVFGVLGVYEDIGDEKAAEVQQRLAATVFDKSQDGITITDASANIIAVNPAFCRITGYAPEEVLGRNHRVLQSGLQDTAFYQAMWQALNREGCWRGDILNRRKNGEIFPEILSITAVHDDRGQLLHYISVFTDIGERKAMEESLRVARDEAEAANRAKSEFLASMSHELRTPLNAILGFSQLFALDPGLSAESRQHAAEIEHAGNHLLALINDIIDLSRIEAGKLTLSLEAVPVRTVVQESLQMVDAMARERGITLIDLDGSAEDALVRADYLRLRQVLINLLTNAIKYNRGDGEVRLSCSRADEGIRITVSDSGDGIPRAKQGRIFTMFDRLGVERGTVEGTGIGLVIARRLVEAMGGGIGFDSREGEGSRFWVVFPPCLRDSDAPRRSAIGVAPVSQEGVSGIRRSVVLYIEDNPMNQRLMRQVFTRRPDLDLRDAHSAEIGLELIRSEPPRLILMDINLPGMDGYAALRVLHADPVTAPIPVLAISANAMKGDVEQGLAAGFEAYFTKPIDVHQLLAAVAHHLPPAGETPHG